MSDYQPEIGDLVDVSCQTYCGAQGNLHGISPSLRGKRGIVEEVEAPNVGDHIYRVRFYDPEYAKYAANPGQGIRMYFKLSELEKVDRVVDTTAAK